MLNVQNVSKYFGNRLIIDDISFELKKGDIAGLLGPNGAGKTTTMRMIASYYFPNKGKILINGYDTQEKTQISQAQVGYLPENNPLYLDTFVVEHLSMTAKLYGMDKNLISERINEVSESVGIQDKLGTYIGELSKGYKQRVGLASALIHDPDLLVLDEPTEGLDPIQREEIRKLIIKLSKNKAILISTHVLQEVKAMCNRVILIDSGKLVLDGSLDTLTDGHNIEIKLEGEKVVETIEKFAEKNKIKAVIKSKNNKVKEITIKTDKEIRPELSQLVARNNWVVWEMQKQDSLENIFKDLKHEN